MVALYRLANLLLPLSALFNKTQGASVQDDSTGEEVHRLHEPLDMKQHVETVIAIASDLLEKAGVDKDTQGQIVETIRVEVEAWTEQVKEDFERDPIKTTAIAAFNAAIFINPGIVFGPALKVIGFGKYIRAGALATKWQSRIGRVRPSSLFSFLQSAGAGGRAAGVMNNIARGGMFAQKATQWFQGGNRDSDEDGPRAKLQCEEQEGKDVKYGEKRQQDDKCDLQAQPHV
ncbi:hypothetical protein GGS20DRAFT_528369 [Poronia punctata]|nr:hypothetical protein GGS20DRAFT_528369 [Poronia punctata]